MARPCSTPFGSVRFVGCVKFVVIVAFCKPPVCKATCTAVLNSSMVGVQYTRENAGLLDWVFVVNVQNTTGLNGSGGGELGQVTVSTPYCSEILPWTGMATLQPFEVPDMVNPVPLEKGVKLPYSVTCMTQKLSHGT